MVKELIWLLPFLFVLAACRDNGTSELARLQAEIAAVEAEAGTITEIDCPLKIPTEVEGETYACGVYSAPVNYADPELGFINLTYVLLRAESANPLPDPIVYLAGGPGQSGVASAGGSLYEDLRQERDLIFPAQRGTLFSRRLALDECVALLGEQIGRDELNAFVDEISERDELDRSLPYDQYLAQYSETAGAINGRCHKAFSEAGLDPRQFNTANSTQDLVGLLEALGYDSYNLHGTSYGTRLALETMRRHPDAPVRSVVLDSPVAPTTERLARLAISTHEALEQLFVDCQADVDCNDAYPNMLDRTVALLAQLEARPLTVGEETIGHEEVLTQLADLSATRGNFLPRMIAELEAGETATYLALLNGEVGTKLPEGSLVSDTVSDLIQQISIAGMTPDNPFAGLQVVKDVLDGVKEENPREAMKAAAQESLAESDSLPRILQSIDGLTTEDLTSLDETMSGGETEPDEANVQLVMEATTKNNAHFLQNGIICLEELPFETVDTALALRDGLPIPTLGLSDAYLATEIGNCANYPMGDPDPRYNEAVSSDVPTLILQGEFDTRTPPENGRALAEQLEKGTLVMVPQAGHETWGSGNCAAQIGIEFIRDPSQTPDLSCLEVRQERFSLPNDTLAP